MARVTLQEYCAEARSLIGQRAYDQAIAICRHILKRYPKHIRTYQVLGEACLDKGQLDEATDVLKRLLNQADPENFVAYAGLGVIHEEQGHFEEAIWFMERAFELAPNREEVRNALRRLYGKCDGTEPTRIKLNKAALARLYARGGQYRQAIDEFRTLLAEDENRIDLKVSLAETLWRDGRKEQAAEVAREILQSCPECLKAILLLGAAQLERGRTEEGQATLERARALDPENSVAQALFGEHSPLTPTMVKIPRAVPSEFIMPVEAETEVAPPLVDKVPEIEAMPAPVAEPAPEPEVPGEADAEMAAKAVSAAAIAEPEMESEALVVEEAVAPAADVELAPPLPAEAEAVAESIRVELESPVLTAVEPEAPPVEAEWVAPEPIAVGTIASLAEAEPLPPPPVEAEVAAVSAELVLPAPAAVEEAAPLVEAELGVAVRREPEEVVPVAEAALTSAAEPSAELEGVAAEGAPAKELMSEEASRAEVEPAEVVELTTPVLESPPSVEAAVEMLAEAHAEGEETAFVATEAEAASGAPAVFEGPEAETLGAEEALLEEPLTPDTTMAASPLSDIERYRLLLEQAPKDDSTRLLLARAYCDQEQMKLALEHYGKLVRSKSPILTEAIRDVEVLVASRPDNLEAHELLADLYAKSGRLQDSVNRYRWILRRIEESAD